MAVDRHRNQVALVPFGDFEDIVRRIATGQDGTNLKSLGPELFFDPLQISPILAHFFGFPHPLLISRHEAIGDMNDRDLGVGQRGQWADVLQNGVIGRRVLEWYQNVAVHGWYFYLANHSRIVATSKYTFNPIIIKATNQETITSHRALTNFPIF